MLNLRRALKNACAQSRNPRAAEGLSLEMVGCIKDNSRNPSLKEGASCNFLMEKSIKGNLEMEIFKEKGLICFQMEVYIMDN